MSQKKSDQKAKELETYYAQFPDWYWKYGLHDAVILSTAELSLPPDWKAEQSRCNCFEICLDSRGAIYETDIRNIRLYNYRILTPDIHINELKLPWWIGDTLTQLPNGGYRLEIDIEDATGHLVRFAVEFQIPEVERK